jgi:predicted Zn-dependent protease
MAIHFASARHATATPFARFLIKRVSLEAANDNTMIQRNSKALQEALRHFAAHGLGAAREARSKAERAFFAGDRAAYDRWLEICRILDRRMARTLVQSVEHDDVRV